MLAPLQLCSTLIACLAGAVSSWALSAPPQEFKITANVDYVLLDVSVRDKHGVFVPDLTAQSFEVSDDGQRRKLSYFATADSPVALGLVIDNSGSMAVKRPEVIVAGLAFARESNPKDEFFVVHFDDSVTFGLPPNVPFTDNLQLLSRALYLAQARGRTALYDAINDSLKHLTRSTHPRRNLVIVSDGRDNASHLGWHQLEQTLESSQVTAYTIGLYDPYQNDKDPAVLRKIAHITGGEYFQPRDVADLDTDFKTIAHEVRQRYSLGYTPDETTDTKQLRSVKVIARRDGHKLVVHTRSSYRLASKPEPNQ